jgi:hypothetical protein
LTAVLAGLAGRAIFFETVLRAGRRGRVALLTLRTGLAAAARFLARVRARVGARAGAGARFAVFRAALARVRPLPAALAVARFLPGDGRAAAREELRFGRLARLPVGRFLAITV